VRQPPSEMEYFDLFAPKPCRRKAKMSAASKVKAYPIDMLVATFLSMPEAREPLVWGSTTG
jgi:hypothetical protein